MVVTRKIITNPSKIRERIHNKVKQAVQAKFPIKGQFYTADISDLRVDHKPLSHTQQKKIKMGKGNASDALICTLTITDNASGKDIQVIKKHRLMNIPYYTDRFSFIVEGNEYNIVNQLRTKSGVYTRRRGNDELESSFNLQAGANFKLIMDPDTGKFSVDILHSKLPLVPLLKILGASSAEIQDSFGKDLYDKNKTTTASAKDRVTDTLYKKLIQYKNNGSDTASKDEKEKAIRAYFDGTQLSTETTKLTLGESHSKVGKNTMLQAVKKMLRVFKNEEKIDDRDNLEFQKVFGPEDIISEVVEKSVSEVNKIKAKLDSFSFKADMKPGTPEAAKKLKLIFSPSYFTRPLKSFIATSSISRLTDQINPLEIMQNSALVTRLGEGAIGSEDSVPEETRAVNYSYLGTIDPVMSPESSKIGIDNHFAIDALKGDDNELYKNVLNTKTDKLEQKRVIDLFDKKVGFPDPKYVKAGDKKPDDKIGSVYKGEMVEVKRSELDYQIPDTTKLSSLSTNNIPFINANQGNRILMAAKHQTQAMPLKDRDTRLVEPMLDAAKDHSITHKLGSFLIPKAPVTGTVSKITEDYIYVKDDDGKNHEVDYAQHLPLASKTMLHNNLSVSVGDSVKAGEALGDNNFTKDGHLALGKNLRVAYMPYKGYNHEDGIIISESAAQKLTSMHTETIHVNLDKTVTVDKAKFVSAYPAKYTQEQLDKIGPDGVVKKGTELKEGDPLILILGDASENRVNKVLGNLHKSLMRNYSDQSEVYEEDSPGKVVEVQKSNRGITVMLAKEKKAKVGDKLSGSYGNKGVTTLIQPDDKMPHDDQGRPMDAIMTSAGIISRINPAQILETALGKVADKTGKPYKLESYDRDDYVSFVRGELKKHGVSEKDTLTDPETGKKIPGIFTGIQHTHKMHKTTDTNFSARGVLGGYDQDESPVGSGKSGPKALGGMEVNALIAHNARNLLRESTMLRGSRNQDFWNNYQYGGTAQYPNEKPTFTKFLTTLKQAGVNVTRKGDEFIAAPLMDSDIDKMSHGEIQNARRVDSKNVAPEKGGLFDEVITGGLDGNRWSHINLAEPVVNPVFEDCVSALLEIPKNSVKLALRNEGGDALRNRLNKINVPRELTQIKKALEDPKLKGMMLDKKVRKMQYLRALDERGLKAGDAYMLTKFPVTPPKMRPISVGKTGDLMENDANEFYKDLILTNNEFKETKKQTGFTDEKKDQRLALQEQVNAIAGTIAPTTQSLKNKNAKGAIKFLSGDQPKHGFFQRKVVRTKMNLSSRATITPDQTLGLDEVGMPVDMAWDMYQPFILRKLSEMGYSAFQAKQEVEDRTDTAKRILEDELEKRPAIINRAPTLWKHSIIAAKPKLRSGKNIGVNTLWEKGTNADFDGDSVLNSIRVRVSEGDKNKKNQSSLLTGVEKWLELKHGSNTTTNHVKGETMPFSDTHLRTVKGLINLEDFPRIEESKRVERNIEKYDVPANIEILSVMNGESAWLPVKEFSIHKNLDMKEVKTNSKRTIHCSSDDSLISLDENLDYCKVAPDWGLTIPRVTEPVTTKDEAQLLQVIRITDTDLTLDRDMGWLSGAFVGDGWLDAQGNALKNRKANFAVMVCKDNKCFQDKWKSVYREYTPDQHFTVTENPHEYDGSAALSVKLTAYNAIFKEYFHTYFGQTAAKKSLPYFWMETTEEFRWGLLAGLIDSDGTVTVMQAKSKKNPQIMVAYSSISKTLIYEIAALADSLGLTATPYFVKRTSAGNESWGITFNTASIAVLQDKLVLHHSKKRDALASFKIKASSQEIAEQNQLTPRISSERLRELRTSIKGKRIYKKKKKGETGPKELAVPENEVAHWKQVDSIKVVLAKLIKTDGILTRQMAKKIISIGSPLFETSDFWKKWKDIVLDDAIVWEEITYIRPIPVTTAYDITAPPNYTMVTESGFVIQDTMTVHLPISDEAIEETKQMFPSKLIFSDKKEGDLIMTPSQEPITGLYKATRNLGGPLAGAVKKFKTEADAWKAYNNGSLKMTDKVEIG